MQIFNESGDAVEIRVFCNTIHYSDKPTEMGAREPRNIVAEEAKFMQNNGVVFTCPVCRIAVVVVPRDR